MFRRFDPIVGNYKRLEPMPIAIFVDFARTGRVEFASGGSEGKAQL